MIELLSSLGLQAVEMDHYEYTFYVTCIRDDKIVFFLPTDEISQVLDFVSIIPDVRERFFDLVHNKEILHTHITLPAFLWDLYVVAVHDNQQRPAFDEMAVNQLERDRFVARKIVIEYKSEDDLQHQIVHHLLPERELDAVLTEHLRELAESTNMDEILKDTEIQRKELDDELVDPGKAITYSHIIHYLKRIQEKIGI
ncbi:ABC-three component system middle component 1 [Paenibacillus ehimensis]|uniref:Uncharacterized protein n=1 Tax=Paenibacillus ehimensis TaxID=79264 RepID=A0ABT8VFH8_9BACL|nr:ABC-three component system middle component 1 [Paenibacillus ehimensis]MDO3679731.1 hypothetical protein [Paenibacillus ehimensis]